MRLQSLLTYVPGWGPHSGNPVRQLAAHSTPLLSEPSFYSPLSPSGDALPLQRPRSSSRSLTPHPELPEGPSTARPHCKAQANETRCEDPHLCRTQGHAPRPRPSTARHRSPPQHPLPALSTGTAPPSRTPTHAHPAASRPHPDAILRPAERSRRYHLVRGQLPGGNYLLAGSFALATPPLPPPEVVSAVGRTP